MTAVVYAVGAYATDGDGPPEVVALYDNLAAAEEDRDRRNASDRGAREGIVEYRVDEMKVQR